MRQQTFAEGTFEVYAKPTRRAAFLADMERVVPWSELCAVIAPFYPKGEGGRPTVDLERMLRIDFLQQWFNLSDPAVEEALYDSVSMRRFVGIDLGAKPRRTKPLFFASATCWRNTTWARSCSSRCIGTWKPKG